MVSSALSLAGLAVLGVSSVPVEQHFVSLAMANALAESALASCRAMNRDAVVAVVDRGGNLIALQRGDLVGPHNTRAAERKAFTALSTKTSTAVLAERAGNDPGSRNLVSVPELLLLGGGVPIVHEGEVIGGIGVAGSGGSASDEACASAALAAVRS
ncbi:MAG: heme-binding protein [Porphyrobacter sp.]|jgi:uncharacterized protein GlcG (DUF336 family)|nr:heme-binding protein [Porphyrobacter sp.]